LKTEEEGDGEQERLMDIEEAAPRGLKHPKSKPKSKKKKVTLHELGPRLTMQLLKIEEKVFEGEVHYHKFSMSRMDGCCCDAFILLSSIFFSFVCLV
jgi:hypothetical protein